MAEQRFYESHFCFDIGLRIYAKICTIEELVALSEMPSASSYDWTKVLREPLFFWHRIKNLRTILHNWRVGSALRDAFCVELWLNKGFTRAFYKSQFCFEFGLGIYAKFYTIEELVALSGMPSASSYGWTKVLREPLFVWQRIKNLRKILHNWRVGSILRDAFCVELWLNKGFTRATFVLTSD